MTDIHFAFRAVNPNSYPYLYYSYITLIQQQHLHFIVSVWFYWNIVVKFWILICKHCDETNLSFALLPSGIYEELKNLQCKTLWYKQRKKIHDK